MTPSDSAKSPGGSSILRHEAQEREWEPPTEAASEEIERHLTRFFGAPSTVFHEIVSEKIHLDIHIISPRPERNWWTLFTTGMSALPMTAPPEAEEFRYAELVLALPPEWKVG